MSYSIFTICTENYRDAWDVVRASWLRTSADKVIIYTDSKDWQERDSRIEIVPLFGKSDSWLTNVGHKVQATNDVLERVGGNLVFVDIDCWLSYDPVETFSLDFDLAVTRLNDLKTAVSTGIYFIRDNEFMRKFCREWLVLQECILERNPQLRERTCSHSQAAFSGLCRKYKEDRKILDLPVEVYNRKVKRSVLEDVLGEKDRIKVFHFYNLAFRDKICVDAIMGSKK